MSAKITIKTEVKKYINQYYDVKDIAEMKGHEAYRSCNVSCVSMLTEEDVNIVLKKFLRKYGYNNKFQWEENLIAYLKEKGFKCNAVTDLAYPKSRLITEEEIKKIMKTIREEEAIIFYHKAGHYYLVNGYEIDEDNNLFFIANDPAGDRKLAIKNRKRESGKDVRYPIVMIKKEKIFGRCWAITK